MDRYLKHKFFEDKGFEGQYKEGVETLRISSWDKFHEIIQIFNEPIRSSIHYEEVARIKKEGLFIELLTVDKLLGFSEERISDKMFEFD